MPNFRKDLFIIYLFLAVSGLSCGTREVRCGTRASLLLWCAGFLFSSCGMRAPEHVGSVVCGPRALLLRRASSVVVAHGLSCPAACGILVP